MENSQPLYANCTKVSNDTVQCRNCLRLVHVDEMNMSTEFDKEQLMILGEQREQRIPLLTHSNIINVSCPYCKNLLFSFEKERE